MLREGSPFMEFLAVVVLLALSGAAVVSLAIYAPGAEAASNFFTQAAQTLLGAVIALAYAARGVSSGRDTNVTVKPEDDPTRH